MSLNTQSLWELEEKGLNKLTGSQRAFLFAPERFSAIAGGFASGKTRVGCLKGLILSSVFPNNRGMIGRYRGSDLVDSTMPSFFEVCPPSWIRSYNKQQQVVTLKNNSQIFFRHIHDPKAGSATKTRRVGANLGWFFIDQMEEIDLEHWNSMVSRLRHTAVPKQFGFGALNPAGHDWIHKMFFSTFRNFDEKTGLLNGKFYQECRPMKSILGIAVNSEEMRKSNGGFVDDDFYDSLLNIYPPEWQNRYIRSSFDDFSGKIYKSFHGGLDDPEYASVHVIQPFVIPAHWKCIVGIDVGGDSPWAVVPNFIDERGNLIVTPGLVKPSVNTAEIAEWIKRNLPWQNTNTIFTIDWENKLAMLELADHGIHCRPAIKHIKTGILRTGGYFHVQKGRPLPSWYTETQLQERIDRLATKGAPRIYVFNTFREFIKEHDEYSWNPNKPDEPLKTGTKRFDTCDAERYIIMQRPEASQLLDIVDPRYEALLKVDPLSARAWESFDKRIAARIRQQQGEGVLREAVCEELDPFPTPVGGGPERYEWN